MKRMLSAIGVAVLTFSLQAIPLTQSSSVVAGVVLNATSGQPLAEVRVTLVPATSTTNQIMRTPEPQPSAITDADGHFSIETTQVGGLRVVPTKNGFVSYREAYRGAPNRSPGLPGAWVQVTGRTQILNLELGMAASAAISGRILDAGGRPVTDGSVVLSRYAYDEDGKKVLRPVPGITSPSNNLNDRGEFRSYDLQPGDYYLGVWAPPGLGIVSDLGYLYYPHLSREVSNAIPIQARAGEEVDIGALLLPTRQKSVEFRLRITSPGVRATATVDVGDQGFTVPLQSKSGEKVLRILPGHYNLLVRDHARSPEYYAISSFDVVGSDVFQNLVLVPLPIVTGRIVLKDASGETTAAPSSVVCSLKSKQFYTQNCLDSRPVPGHYQLDFRGFPPNTYVLSATAAGRDVLKEGLNIVGDTALEIVLAHPGASVDGIVRVATGDTLINGTVVLAPDERGASFRYYSFLTDADGRFELECVAPGSYKLFAWTELEGAAYRNTEFMQEFDDRGRLVTLESGARETVNLTAF